MESFRQNNRFIDISSEANYIQGRLERLETEKASLELQFQYYEYLDEYLASKEMNGAIISPSVMGITDQVLIRLVSELSAAQKRLEEVEFNLNSEQEAYSLMKRQLDQTRLALEENVGNGQENLRISIANVENRISSVEEELGNLPSTERHLVNIQRKFDLNNTVYTYLLEKRSEAEIARASNVSDNRVIRQGGMA